MTEYLMWYGIGMLAWAFVMGLVGANEDMNGFEIMANIALWPVCAAGTIGALIRSTFL